MNNYLIKEIVLQVEGKGLCPLCGREKDNRLIVCAECQETLVNSIVGLIIEKRAKEEGDQ
ncbi:MAG: hypothetical protein KAS32_05135 [Candidatus Peribacteraceae bacterium]|nr:hypothetical protein [Candidatus Peribacteraceae bacterium]